MRRKRLSILKRNTLAMATLRRCLLVFSLALNSTLACAELSGTVSVVSDYRFRGQSLSQGNPEAQLNLTLDTNSGWYGGAFMSGVNLDGHDDTQLLAYGGYAQTLKPGWSWDAGVIDSTFLASSDYNYAEIYLGIASEHVNAKLYVSPNYFGFSTRTAYAELNGNYPISDNWRVQAHVGCLARIDGDKEFPARRWDGQVGIATMLHQWTLQLAWVIAQKNPGNYQSYSDLHPHTLVLDASYAF
jgi:uncharacterized protein (TIGR02001 family)